MTAAAVVVAMVWAPAIAHAAERTVTLEVANMTCASCPYIVRQVLSRVPGVTAVEVSYASKQAVVTFDDEKADVAALTEATAGIGFPSKLASGSEHD